VLQDLGAPIAADGEDWNAILRLRERTRAEILKHCGEPDLAGEIISIPFA